MPYVKVEVAGQLNRDQKAQIADEISETLLKVAGKPKNVTYVVFEEVSRENWAVGGELLG